MADTPILHPVDVAFGALMEVGRRDLAMLIAWFEDEQGGYLEADGEILSHHEWDLIDKAENLARASAGQPPRPKRALS